MPEGQPVSFEDLARVVAGMQGHRVWHSTVGRSDTAIFKLELGEPLPDDNQQGTFSLCVYCAWRIVEADRVACGWHDDARTTVAPALQQLWHSGEVRQATVSPLGDLNLSFANGLILQIWNDAPLYVEDPECWTLSHQGQGYYAVEVRNRFLYHPEFTA